MTNGHVIGTITARMFNALGARDVEEGALLPVASAIKVRGGVEVDADGKSAGKGYLGSEECAFTLAATQDQWLAQPVAIQGTVIGRSETAGPQGSGADASGAMFTLTKTDVHAVAQPYIGGVDYENNAHGMDEATGPLLKGSPTGGGRPLPAIATAMQVRRLTPVECERLQGFPDGYTAIPWRNKPAAECPDGPRYKALGNSMAVPVMSWIGERINQVEQL
jgi:hypothetical protein